MKLLIILFTLGISWAELIDFLGVEVDPGYDCMYCQPEQVHIAYGDKTNDIVVVWSTWDDTKESRVLYGEKEINIDVNGTSTLFKDGGRGGADKRQYIHKVILKDLKYDTRYVYHAGSQYGWTEKFSFKTPPQGEDWMVSAAIYGDMGAENAHSMSYLQLENDNENFDVVLHVGDFAYDMHDREGRVGDQFMRQIQPLAASVPYMTCPGNHEENGNFSNYKARFSMPGGERMFYSFDLGPVHFISVDTEYYYFLQYGIKMVHNQYEWLQHDLAEANKPENRLRRPWIVLMGHRPMYCTDIHDPDCTYEFTRTGLPFVNLYGLEPLLNEFGVDVVIWAHEHSYERTWPLYDQRVYNGSLQQPYVNPKAPVHIITGSAGCKEETDGFKKPPPEWSAFRSSDYGYTRFKAYNKTHIYFEQVDVDLKGQVIDQIWIVKDQHMPYGL